MSKQKELLREEVKRGEPGYPFQIYSGHPFTSNHWHDEVELIYVAKGELEITINGTEYCGKMGDIFAVNKNEMHSLHYESEDTLYYALVFDLSMLFFVTEDISEKQFMLPLSKGKIQFVNRISFDSRLIEIFDKIIKYNSQKNYGYMLGTKAALLEFLSIIMSGKQYYITEETSQDTLKNELLKKIIRYIEEHIDNKITLCEISSEFNMSSKYFCRFFKKNFKKTLVEYINHLRIERALYMIDDDNYTIMEIALSCGFSNASYFARVFKKVTGCSPSKYFSN